MHHEKPLSGIYVDSLKAESIFSISVYPHYLAQDLAWNPYDRMNSVFMSFSVLILLVQVWLSISPLCLHRDIVVRTKWGMYGKVLWHTIWFSPCYGVRVLWRWKWTQGPFCPPRGSRMEQQRQLHSNGPAWTISWLPPKPLSLLHYWQGWGPRKGDEERLIAASRRVRSRKKVGEKNSQTMREACHIISTQENCMKRSFKVKRPKQR